MPPSAAVSAAAAPRKKPVRFVAVPDNRNVLKYLFAQPARTRAQPEPELPPAPRAVAFQFGVLADVQFAHLPVARGVKTVQDAGRRVALRRRRAWRESLLKLQRAIVAFNKTDVDFVVSLGDAVEGYGPARLRDTVRDLVDVLSAFSASRASVHHVVGNHCRQLPMPAIKVAMRLDCPFYSFKPAPGWRGVVLHSAELCARAVDATEEEKTSLKAIVEREGRPEHHFHGAIGDEQLKWLAAQLEEAKGAGERVIVFSHYPLADDSARPSHVLANTSAVRELIETDGSPVVLCLAGHDHMGGLLTVPAGENRGGITYVTVPAILEAPKGGNAFAIVTAYSDGSLAIDGVGSVTSVAVDGKDAAALHSPLPEKCSDAVPSS